MNIKKRILPILLAAVVSVSGLSAFSASAAWEKTDSGTKYTNSKGEYVTGWLTMKNGNKYYFKKDGTMVTGWFKSGGNKYYFDSNGKMVTGDIVINSKQYTFSKNGVWNGEQGLLVTEYDFRSSKWGDTRTKVEKDDELGDLEYYAEGLSIADGTAKIGNYRYYVLYDFQSHTDNKPSTLIGGYYIMDTKNEPSASAVYKEYENLFYTYTKKYGEPTNISTNWKSSYYESTYSDDIATALKYGYLKISANFETKTTNIIVLISQADYQVQIGILYSDKNIVSSNVALDGDI